LTNRIFARSHLSLENIRKEIEGRTVFREGVDLGRNSVQRRNQACAAVRRGRGGSAAHNFIGTEHLLLGILREERSWQRPS
jgi:ATP-dependent Clp protease ATP-binding subunit ClpC